MLGCFYARKINVTTPTKYFLGLEKRNQLKNCIKSKDSQGTLISEQHNILQHLANYYKSLYQAHEQFTENKCFNLVNRLTVPTIAKIDKMDCDKLISEKESETAIS